MVSMIYMVLATAMFFLQDTYFLVAGMELSLKNPCALAILFLALLNFIVTVRLDRLMVLIRHTAVQVLPYLIPLVFSAVIWVSTKAGGAAVMNGVSMIFPQMLSVLVAAATLYLFGEKGIWYCLGAMCAANFISILVVVYTGGFSEFLQELYILLATFSKETGPLMMRLETHDLTFAFGPFLLYLMLHWKKSPHPLLWLVLVSCFWLVGLKRIAFPALASGLLSALLLRRVPILSCLTEPVIQPCRQPAPEPDPIPKKTDIQVHTEKIVVDLSLCTQRNCLHCPGKPLHHTLKPCPPPYVSKTDFVVGLHICK